MGKRSGSLASTRYSGASGTTQLGAENLRTPQADKLLTELKGKLTPKETQALSAYAYGKDQDINRMLRKIAQPADKKATQGLVKSIDSAMKKAPGLPQKTVLYRGVDGIKSFPKGFFNGVVAGKSFTDKAYTSTSFNVKGFNTRFGNSDIVMKIIAPKGMKGIPMHRGHGKKTGVEYEKEFLLPRGLKFQVVAHKARTSRKDGSTRHYMTVKIVKE